MNSIIRELLLRNFCGECLLGSHSLWLLMLDLYQEYRFYNLRCQNQSSWKIQLVFEGCLPHKNYVVIYRSFTLSFGCSSNARICTVWIFDGFLLAHCLRGVIKFTIYMSLEFRFVSAIEFFYEVPLMRHHTTFLHHVSHHRQQHLHHHHHHHRRLHHHHHHHHQFCNVSRSDLVSSQQDCKKRSSDLPCWSFCS